MKSVTLGWDGLPTTINEDGTILPRKAELIINQKYYPNWPDETWPVDPVTHEKLPIESRGDNVLQRHAKGDRRNGGKNLAERARRMVQTLLRH